MAEKRKTRGDASHPWVYLVTLHGASVLVFLCTLVHASFAKDIVPQEINSTFATKNLTEENLKKNVTKSFSSTVSTIVSTRMNETAPFYKVAKNKTPKHVSHIEHRIHYPNIPETHVYDQKKQNQKTTDKPASAVTRKPSHKKQRKTIAHIYPSSTKHEGDYKHHGRTEQREQQPPLAEAGITDTRKYDKHHTFKSDRMYHRAQYPSEHFENHLKVPGMIGKAEAHMNFRQNPDESNDNKTGPQFYNYKLLYNAIERRQTVHHRQTSFYGWIFGSALLALGLFTTLALIMVLCFCTEKWKKRKKKRQLDQMGVYQRVDSVSSVVSNMSERSRNFDDYEPIESTSMI